VSTLVGKRSAICKTVLPWTVKQSSHGIQSRSYNRHRAGVWKPLCFHPSLTISGLHHPPFLAVTSHLRVELFGACPSRVGLRLIRILCAELRSFFVSLFGKSSRCGRSPWLCLRFLRRTRKISTVGFPDYLFGRGDPSIECLFGFDCRTKRGEASPS